MTNPASPLPNTTVSAAASAPFRIARTREEILSAAAARGLAIPVECLEGVEANMALLASHAARLADDGSRVA
ncbi:hypothetical protein [Novosphingobium sp. 9]|uniref:hypothetical protein n=1 Tax=Novosphingobium sp. 9 TaxID=2025349 RepID=UPI0021B69E69|nr:hypothetical protein [Novosphingobium sp. 9]